MATLRRGASGSRPAARAGQPGILLDSESPYGSRRVVVEYDGATTAAYLHDADAIVGAAWIANHQQAPSSTDLSRLEAGRAPLMPAGHTKHPAAGRPWTPAPCARCGSRRATGWPSSRAASSWPSSRAGPTCPGGCPGTAGTSWARARSAGRSMTPWRAWARGPTGRRRSGAGASAMTPGRASSGRCWATSWPGSGPARGTGTSAAGGCRRWGCPSARPPSSAPTRCCPRSG